MVETEGSCHCPPGKRGGHVGPPFLDAGAWLWCPGSRIYKAIPALFSFQKTRDSCRHWSALELTLLQTFHLQLRQSPGKGLSLLSIFVLVEAFPFLLSLSREITQAKDKPKIILLKVASPVLSRWFFWTSLNFEVAWRKIWEWFYLLFPLLSIGQSVPPLPHLWAPGGGDQGLNNQQSGVDPSRGKTRSTREIWQPIHSYLG